MLLESICDSECVTVAESGSLTALLRNGAASVFGLSQEVQEAILLERL